MGWCHYLRYVIILCIYHHSYNGKQDVLVIEEYGVKGSWTKFTSIPCLDQYFAHRPLSTWFILLKSGEITFLVIDDCRIFLYKSKAVIVKNLRCQSYVKHPHFI